MTGPSLEYKPDNDPVFRDTRAWYCGIPGVTPGGYSTQDGISGPDAGDRVVMKQWTAQPALAALHAIQAGKQPTLDGMVALFLHAHEFCHCYVRLDLQGNPLPEDLERYSHPETAFAAILHALRNRLPINAFTRLLRWQENPPEAWQEFLVWFNEKTTPLPVPTVSALPIASLETVVPVPVGRAT